MFAGLAIFLIAFAIGLWFLSGKLLSWVHGAEDVTPDPEHEVGTGAAVV